MGPHDELTLGRRLRERLIDLAIWRWRSISAKEADIADWPQDRYAITLPVASLRKGPSGGMARFRGAILDLDIFPIGTVKLAVDTADGIAAAGSTVVERVYLGPFGLETAVRITDIQDRPGGVALTWATLDGHPERGIETFSVDLRADGALDILICARSRPATVLVRLGMPFTRWLQRRYPRAALRHLADISRG